MEERKFQVCWISRKSQKKKTTLDRDFCDGGWCLLFANLFLLLNHDFFYLSVFRPFCLSTVRARLCPTANVLPNSCQRWEIVVSVPLRKTPSPHHTSPTVRQCCGIIVCIPLRKSPPDSSSVVRDCCLCPTAKFPTHVHGTGLLSLFFFRFFFTPAAFVWACLCPPHRTTLRICLILLIFFICLFFLSVFLNFHK